MQMIQMGCSFRKARTAESRNTPSETKNAAPKAIPSGKNTVWPTESSAVAISPTTAGRMDFAAPALYRAGVVASIGKGSRSAEVTRACVETGSVYLCSIGGCAALLAKCVTDAQTVAWEDLGTEALRRLEVVDFPCFVATDTQGNDVYAQVIEAGSR